MYCLEPVRVDGSLGAEVNERLIAWIEEIGAYPGQVDQVRAIDANPVLVGLRAYLGRVARFASPAQVNRVRHETDAMFVAMGGEAGWGDHPAGVGVPGGFLPCMTLIDVIGGYELPGSLSTPTPPRHHAGRQREHRPRRPALHGQAEGGQSRRINRNTSEYLLS
ncbi:hypothetical protein ACOBQX_28840 [Actinokineospora sp. G85]|uniref:hypothetical protein n=1 Tax=Actinokineospora sp. G85 TaxID=3406626 RepID=UPI003C77C1CF